jgi:hypothetical protein
MQVEGAIAREHMRLYGALRRHYDPFGTGAKIGNVRLPNFKANNEGFTKTEPTRSDEEILEAIRELAKKHAEKGTFHNADNEYLDLVKEYVSSVSPDREGILASALKEISGKINSEKTNLLKADKEEQLSILQQTLQLISKSKNKNAAIINPKANGDAVMSGSTYNVWSIDGNGVKYAGFHDGNGESIADYDTQSGWHLYSTKAEIERGREIDAAYNEAFNSVYNAQNASTSRSLVSGNNFDVVG